MPRRMTIGQLLIQRALPEDLRDPNRVLDKEGLGELMKTLATRDPDQYRKTTYELQRVGAEIAYRSGGASFGLRHLAQTEGMKQRRKELEAQIQKVLTDDEVPREEKRGKIADMLRDFVKPEQDAIMKESLENKNPLALQVVSGARGSAGNMMSLLGGDAMYVDANDEPIPIAVLRGFAQGLRPAEYWAATYGARKSVIETKLGVQNAGDLGKQLTRAAHRAMIVGLDRDGDEPTLRGLPVDTDDSDNEGALLAAPAGRFERNTILTRQHLDELKKAGINRILLRSPAVSQTEEGGVWARDVGVREFGRLPRQGEFVGITAAQALCLAEGTSVRMADGRVKAIEAVRPGELVLGSDTAGVVRPVRVLSLFENGEKDCVEYAFRRGTGAVSSENILKLVCTPEHKLLSEIVIRSGSPDSKYFEPIAIRPVGTTLRNRHDAFCARLSQRFDDSGYRDEPFAMLIGVLIGDGCYTGGVSSGGVSLSCHDQKQIKDLSEFYAEYGIEFVPQTTPGEYRVTDTTASQPKKRQDGSFYRNRVVEWLKTRGMWGAYSHEKKLPPDVHDWSNKSILELLGGLIATDGYVVEATGAIGFSSTSREMLEQVRDLLGIRFGISCASLCEKQKKKADGSQHRSCYALMVCSVQDIRKLEGLLRIPGRKAALLHSVVSRRADSVGNDSRRCRLVSATPVGTRRTFDLYVEHPDHLFVLENGLVVSNSEPLAQATLGAKHGGGAASGNRSRSGFAYIDQLAQVPKVFPGGAAHAEKDGNISSIEKAPAGGYYIGIGDKKHYVPADQRVMVNYGDSVEAGDVLSDGIPNPAKIVRLKGLGEGRRYFIGAFRDALRNSNIKANRRNVELVTGRLLNHVELDDEVGDFVPGDIVPYSAIEAKWEPRAGFQNTDPRASVGRFLERPYLHYTIGTRITPRVAKELEEFGLSRVDTHDQPPPFQPEMIRAETNLQYDPDWLSRFLGVNLKSNLLKAVPRGGTSDTQSTSYVPALAQAKDFGRTGLIRTPDSSPPQEFEMPKPPPSAEFKPQAITAPKMPEVPKAPAMPKAAAAPPRTAVIITGNPKYIAGNAKADAFYTQLADRLTQRGYSVTRDPGEPFTTPATADLWIGHSRGADRLRFAPPGTRAVGIGSSKFPGAINHPDDDNGPVPNDAHYLLTDEMFNRIVPEEPKGTQTSRTMTRNGATYDINRLIEMARNRPVEQVPLVDLPVVNRSRNTGFSPRRLAEADTQYPILLGGQNQIFDGKHRTQKLRNAGAERVPAVRVSDEDLAAVKMPTVKSSAQAELSGLGLCKLAANPFSRFKGTGFGKAMSGLPGMGGGMSLPTMPGPSLKTPAPTGGMRLGQPIKAPAVPSVPTSPTGGLVNSLRTHQNKLVNVGLAGTAGLAGYQAVKPPPLVQGPSTDPALETVRAAMPTARAPQQAVQQAATQTEGVQQALAPAAKDPTGFLLGRAFHNEELPVGMTVPRDQRESLLTLVSGQDGLRQSLLRPRALSGRELPQSDPSQVADRLLMRSRQTLAGRNPYGVDLRQNAQAPGGHALYAAPGNIATNPYVGINPEAAARRAGGKSPTDWSNPGQHPLAILNHELEHTRQDPAATVQAGGISLSHEVPAGLGDLMFSGETTRKTLNDLYPGTGAGQRALQDIPITYPGGKANQLDWMVNMAKQHGYFDGRSMTDLLNTPQGRQYLRQIVESARQVPVMVKENAESALSRLRRLKKADEMTDALVAAQGGDDGQRSALSGDPNNPYANPMGLQLAMGLYPELPGLLQNLGPLGLAAYGALLSPTDMASLVSGALPKSIRDKILAPGQQPVEEPATAEMPVGAKPVPGPVMSQEPVSSPSPPPSPTTPTEPAAEPTAEPAANQPADPLRADPPVRTQPPGQQLTIDPALAKALRARGIKIRPADTAKRIWSAGGGRLLDSFHNEIDQRILNQFSPETLAGMSHDQLRYLASTITDPQGVKQKTRPVAAPRPGQPVGMGDLKAREGNAQEPNPLYAKEQEQLRRMFNSEAAAKRLGPALNDPKALAAALANEQQELRRSMTPGSNLQVGWQDLYPGTDEAAYRANPQFKADVDRYDQMSNYLKNWDPSEPLDPRQVPGLGEYLEHRTAGGLTPDNPDFRAWALMGGDSPNYGWIRDPIDPGEPVNFLKAVNDYHTKQEAQRRAQRKDVDTRTDPSMIWHGVDIGGSSAAPDPYARHMTMERLAAERGETSPLQIAARSLDDYEKGIQAQDGVTDSFLQSPFAQSLPGFGTMGKNWGKTPAQERLAQTQQLSDHLFGLTSERTLKIPDAQLLPLAQKIVQNPDFQSQYQQAGEPIPQPAALLDDLRVGLSRQAVDHALGRPQQYNDNPGYMLSQLGEAANPLVQQISQGATQAAASKLRWRDGKLMGLDLITAPFLAAARTIGAVPGVQETQEVLSGIPLLGGAAVGAARDYANSDNYTPEQLKQMGYNPKQRLKGGLADIMAAPGRLIDRNLGTRVTWDNPSERARWAATGSSWLEANRSREGTQNFARQMARQERELANITQQLQAMTPDQRGQWVEQMSSTPNGAAAVKQLAEYERANRQGIGSIQRTALMGDKYPEAMKAFRQNLPTILERSGYQFNPKSQMSDMDWDHLAYSMATGLIPPEFKSALTPDKLDVNQLFGGHLGGAAQSGWAGRQLGWGYGALTSGIPMVLDATSSMATIPKTTPIPGTGVRAALGQGYNALPGPVRNAVQGAFPTGQALTSTNALGVAGQQVAQGATPSLLHSATSMMRGTPQLGERPIFRPKLVPLAKGPAKPTTPSPTTPPAVAGRNNLPGS